jgi:hypothetical protein
MQSTDKVIAKFKKKRLADLEALGPVAVAKAVVEHGTELMIDEAEFTGLVTKAAQAAYPGLSAAQAFSKMFTAQTPDGALLRRAWGIMKNMATTMPLQTHSPEAFQDAVSDTESSEAYAQLMALAEAQRVSAPFLSQPQAFARVFAANPELAKRAHQRPAATTAYPFPR